MTEEFKVMDGSDGQPEIVVTEKKEEPECTGLPCESCGGCTDPNCPVHADPQEP